MFPEYASYGAWKIYGKHKALSLTSGKLPEISGKLPDVLIRHYAHETGGETVAKR